MEYADKKIRMKDLVFSFNFNCRKLGEGRKILTSNLREIPLQAFETQFEREDPAKHETISKFKK